MKSLALVFCFAALLTAQTAPKDPGKVSGQVASVVTSEPVRKAKVILHPADPDKPAATSAVPKPEDSGWPGQARP